MPSEPVSSQDSPLIPVATSPVVIAPRTTFGTLVSAMLVGALLAVTGLYLWGAEVAKQQAGTQFPTPTEN